MKIDFVIPWVDGNDPQWQSQRNLYCPQPEALDESRYREWDILHYWFRAVEKYAPWVNRIFFITCGQCPPWLNRDHPKLRLVDHKDFIPQEYLPTFNSMTIELNLHRISELSEHFVYFNDDVFLNRPVCAEDFFIDGLPRDAAIMTNLTPGTVFDPHIHAICNVMAIINTHFRKKTVLRQNPGKWYSLKYGKGLIKNLLNAPGSRFSCFSNPHIATSLRKSSFEAVWQLEPDALDTACRNKFRELNSINQYLIRYYQLCSGSFVPRRADLGICYDIGYNDEAMYRDIRSGNHKLICVNDNVDVQDFEANKARLIAAFQSVLPEKSTFEL